MAGINITIPHNWSPWRHQVNVWNHFAGSPAHGKRGICLWPRRHGKDLTGINIVADQIFRRVGTYWHLFPEFKQGRSIVWNGKDNDGRDYLDYFPKDSIARRYENDMRMHFIHPDKHGEEGSIYQVCGSDNWNSLIGTNPIGVILSEYSLQDPSAWLYLRPILAANNGWALFLYTPRGHNHGYQLFNMAQNDPDWFCEKLTSTTTVRHDGTPVFGKEKIEKERAEGMPEELIQQEYFTSFDAPLVGAYYSQQMSKALLDGRITSVPYDTSLEVNTTWDIGVNDSTAIIFFQRHGMELRLIDYYENSGEGLAHYVRIMREKGYTYGKWHYGPWDIVVKEFGSGKTRIETARSLGLKFTVTKKHEVEDGIEQCRNTFPYVWIDKDKCARLVEALKSYRKKLDEKASYAGQPFFKDHPMHDWSSHAADCFRYLCWNVKMRTVNQWDAPAQTVAKDEYAYV